MINWVAQIFFLLFSGLFEGLVGIMGVRLWKKNLSCYIGLIICKKILI